MEIYFLGTASGQSTSKRDNTSLLVKVFNEVFLIDCSGSPVKKISQVGIDFMNINNILITHVHPDHIYGLPSLVHQMLLKKRKRELNIFCPEKSDSFLHAFLNLFFEKAKNGFKINISPVRLVEKIKIIDSDHYEIFSFSVEHGIEAIGFKIVEKNGKSMVYSGDTKPCLNIIKNALDCDLLIHESTFPHQYEEEVNKGGHTTSFQAGEIASLTRAKKLILTHFDSLCENKESILLKEASVMYKNEILLSFDMMRIEI
ncbi:MAG: MBL fold metallo-hydrolase [Acidobacteriota bacterium]